MARVGIVIPLLVAAGLLVSACGSAGSTPAQKTAPAHTVTGQTVTTQSVRLGRFTQVFDTPLPADPAQARVVGDFRTALVLWDKSTAAFKLVPPITTYVTGSAAHNLASAVAVDKAHNAVPSGLDRFFTTRAVVHSATSATVTTCDDASKFKFVHPATGVPDPYFSMPANQQYLFETWQMVKLSGHWAISAVSLVTLPDTRATPCQP
jgi:hypothetical protein